MKSYYRYAPAGCMGIICSPDAPTIYDQTGKLAFTGAVEKVGVWNLRQASQVCSLSYDNPGYPYAEGGEVTSLALGSEQTTVIAGYSTGEVRLFNYVDKSVLTTLKGHRSAVTALALRDAALLVSGGADGHVVLWDLVARVGVARLRGHKDAVTSLCFLPSASLSRSLLASGSKDTLLKVWDLEACRCLQTVVGHRAEVWALLALPSDGPHRRAKLLTGASDELLRVYIVQDPDAETGEAEEGEAGEAGEAGEGEGERQILTYYGGIGRSTGERCVGISRNHSNSIIAVQSAGKQIDFFRVLDKQGARKRARKRAKRANKGTKEENGEREGEREEEGEGEEKASALLLEDEIEFVHTLRCTSRVRSFLFSPLSSSGGEDSALLALNNNSLELYKVSLSPSFSAAKSSVLDLQGHRSDVRGVAVAGDDLSLATVSSDSVKIWSTRNGQCLGSSRLEHYALCVCFAPGGRFLLIGTKEGALLVGDVASGEVVQTVENAHEGAVWCVSLTADQKGLATGSADKLVKFWAFSLSPRGGLQVASTRQLLTPSDVLALSYTHSSNPQKTLFVTCHLDNLLRVFFADSLSLYLSLYGHKLPSLSVDISSDDTLLVSGSADKTVKIWGMDFGDCHRSLLAHEESVTAVRFVPRTHYFFSAAKDGAVKYWDADRFEQILFLPGHRGSVWGLGVLSDGSSAVSVGGDRGLRLWSRGEDLVFLEEEKERLLEAQADKAATEVVLDQMEDKAGEEGGAVSSAALPSLDSIRSGEQLMQCVDHIEQELPGMMALDLHDPSLSVALHAPSKHPLLLSLSPLRYLVRCLRQVKQPDLEPLLLALPFHYVQRLLFLLLQLARSGLEVEMSCRCAVFLLLCHQHQVSSSASLAPLLLALRDVVGGTIGGYRHMAGVNLAGLRQMQRQLTQDVQDVEATRQILAKDQANKKHKKRKAGKN